MHLQYPFSSLDNNITNLLGFIVSYKFYANFDFHWFIQKLHEFHTMVNMNDILCIQYLKYSNR
jgi:hypothetical protein